MFAPYRAWALCAMAMLTTATAISADLKPETLAAWNSYVAEENADMHRRAAPDEKFLWTDADPKRLIAIKSGTVLVSPAARHTPLHVAQGLIHHWVGAAFIPNATAEEVMAVMRDYPRYKDYYRPAVEDAKSLSSSGDEDEFTVRFANSSILSKVSLEGDYVCRYTKLDGRRWYSVSETRQMQEIKDSGQPAEKRLPPDHGTGYIWRLYSTTRIEERDGGVVVEVEAVALSRDIPGSLHWLVDPVVRRISRESLEKSLAETSAAVRTRTGSVAMNSR